MKKTLYLFFGLRGILILITVLFLACSCSNNPFKRKIKSLTITNWNLQTFFDGNNDGVEYDQFRKSKEMWNEDYYEERLIRLCKLIEEINSDVFVMEEIENEKILYDISNRLSHNAWNKKKMYNYAAFGKEKGNSIGCAVISKHEITDIKFHALDVRTENESAPQMRSVMQVDFNAGDRNLCMFVNHWKSKSGGEEQSEKWRLWQENILAREFAESSQSVLSFATGDFNKDILDFNRTVENEILFTGIGEKENMMFQLYSPWNEQNTDEGSYFFRGKWEKIDHFFFADKNCFEDFTVEKNEKIIKPDGTPARYEIYNHMGYSDHLPITCKVIIN